MKTLFVIVGQKKLSFQELMSKDAEFYCLKNGLLKIDLFEKWVILKSVTSKKGIFENAKFEKFSE